MAPAGKAQSTKGAPPAKKASSVKGKKPTGATAKLLNTAAAWKAKYGEDIERKILPTIAGVGGASTIRNGFAALKKADLAIVTATHVVVSDTGMEEADIGSVTLADRPTTNAEAMEQKKVDLKLKQKEIELVDLMADGRNYSKDDIANALFDGKKNSTLRNFLAALKKKNVIEVVGSSFRLHSDLFPFGRPE
ncbi:MAG: hypothetical protein SGARI_005882 [Bacillariaceae sp.]